MLEILYQDDDLRAYNKPENISLLADRNSSINIWQALKASGEKPYLVHRLDKGTSGVLLVARRQVAQSALTRAFAAQAVTKFYFAWVTGHFPAGCTHRIDLPLCKGRKSRYRVAGKRRAITHTGHMFGVDQDRDGVAAITLARTLSRTGKQDNGRTLLLLKPLSGRTHQIRVHLSWLGFPVLGDQLYGTPDDPYQAAPRLMLHCHRLIIPGWGRFTAPTPPSFPGAA